MEIYKVQMRKKQELNLKSRNIKISDKEVQKESQNKQSGMKNKTLKGENVAEIFLFFVVAKFHQATSFSFTHLAINGKFSYTNLSDFRLLGCEFFIAKAQREILNFKRFLFCL